MPSQTRAPAVADDGVSLVELLVALMVLGLVMAGIVSVTISTLAVTRVNDDRSVATNLAQAELESVRAMEFSDLEVGGRVVRTVESGSASYEVIRDTTWVELDSDTDPCSEDDDSTTEAMIRVEVTVGRVGAERDRVTSNTTIARPPVSPAVDRGALSVLVSDHQDPASPVANVRVEVVGPTEVSGEIRTLVTPATGCVLFTDLPTGSYDVKLQKFDHVSIGGEVEPVRNASVQVAARTSLEFSYAPGGALLLDAAARDGATAVLPADLPVTVSRGELLTPGLRGDTHDPMWPGLWEVWGGDCPAADPLGLDTEGAPHWQGAVRQDRVRVPANGHITATADLAVVRMVVTGVVTTPADPQPVTIVATALDDCSGGTPQLTFAPTVPAFQESQGIVHVALPYGTWQLTASNGVASTTRYAVIDPRETGIVTTNPNPPGGGPP